MKFLAILNAFPYPPTTGSRIVAAHVLRELARHHEVRMLTRDWGPPDLAATWGVDRLRTISSNDHTPSFAERLFEYVTKRSSLLARLTDRRFRNAIAAETESFSPDAILLFEYWAASLVDPALRDTTLINIEDPPSLRQDRLSELRHLPFLKKIRAKIEHWYYSRHEVRHLRSMGRVLLLSETDLKDYREATGLKNLAHCPYGVSPPPPIRPRHERVPNTLAITGNMIHPPNEDGILDFVERVFPEILKQHPATRLRLVGALPTERIRRLSSTHRHIEVTGRVPDINAYLGHCMVAVCPVLLRIGVQTKILEAMRMGTPVVSWTAGNSGIGGTPGKHLEIASSAEEFAEKVVRLLRGEGWDDLSNAGAAFVRSRFGWERSAHAIVSECVNLGLLSPDAEMK